MNILKGQFIPKSKIHIFGHIVCRVVGPRLNTIGLYVTRLVVLKAKEKPNYVFLILG